MQKASNKFAAVHTRTMRFTKIVPVMSLLFLASCVTYGQTTVGVEGWPQHNANQAATCAATTSAEYTMAIQSPCSPDIVTFNQLTVNPLINNGYPGAPADVAITDRNAAMVAQPLPIQVTAPGMVNVEVWTHGKLATRLTEKGGDGVFVGALDLSNEPTGPLSVRFYAWNAPPGDNSFTVSLNGILDLFVRSVSAKIAFPAGAAGMRLAWADEFNTLNAGGCVPGTGAWPNCTYVSATDGYAWFESEPQVQYNFGDAAFECTCDPEHNPYTIENGFLRIRSTYDPDYVDPYGYGRPWYSGLLATQFPDGSTNAPQLQNGYYEARILTPNSWSGCYWCNTSGGTWPAFWQVNLESLEPKEVATGTSIEIDTMEQYGEDPFYTQSGEIAYGHATLPGCGPSPCGEYIYHAYPSNLPDLTADFHRYGLLVTDKTVTTYLDDQVLGSVAKATIPGLRTPYWNLMLDLAMGGGWNVIPPPGNYYDMWIDYVRYYAPK